MGVRGLSCFSSHCPRLPFTDWWSTCAEGQGPQTNWILEMPARSRVSAIGAPLAFAHRPRSLAHEHPPAPVRGPPETLQRSCLIGTLTRKTKGLLEPPLQGKMNNKRGLLPRKKKSNYLCIDFCKGWHWILAQKHIKIIFTLHRKTGKEIMFRDKKTAVKPWKWGQWQNSGLWWKCLQEVLTSSSSDVREGPGSHKTPSSHGVPLSSSHNVEAPFPTLNLM